MILSLTTVVTYVILSCLLQQLCLLRELCQSYSIKGNSVYHNTIMMINMKLPSHEYVNRIKSDTVNHYPTYLPCSFLPVVTDVDLFAGCRKLVKNPKRTKEESKSAK